MKKSLRSGTVLLAAIILSSCSKDDAASPTIIPPIGERAAAIIKSLETGNTQPVTEYVSATQYIQHNLQAADGKDFLLQGVKASSENGTKANIKRIFTDGDMVFLHTEYLNIFGQNMAAFDVYKFDAQGQATEHWDNLQTLTPANASGRTLLDGSTTVSDISKTEENRRLVRNYVKDVLTDHKFDKLPEYIATNLIQHNPQGQDGLAFLQQGSQFLAAITYDTKKVLAQGNFVLVMADAKGFANPTAVYDLFRIENGKIAEHWDVIETIADSSQWANQNGKW